MTISGNLWFIEGPVGKNATLVLKIPKAVYAGVLPQDKFLLNGGGSTWTEHQYTVDSTTEPDYFIITITGINEF